MPWRKREPRRRTLYWWTALSVLLAVGIGVLIGYTRWGTTASVVDLVERQLTKMQIQIDLLEKRVGAIERAKAESPPVVAWPKPSDDLRANMLQAQTTPAKR